MFSPLNAPPAGVVNTCAIVPSYRACRLRAPCRLMLTGMLNDFWGESALRNMDAPLPVPLLHLGSGRRPIDVDHRLTGPDCGALTWQRPVVCPGSRVSARAPSALLHVAMTTAPGEAGRMLISSLWTRASAATPQLNKSLFNDSHLTLHM